MTTKRLIVRALLAICELQDTLHIDNITHRHTFANWSANLDEKWETGVWK